MNPEEIKSPFKFLDPYDKSDREFFFGRDKEVKLLYDFVNKNRVVLVYGQSGTGKTSIIKCGLANEFDVTDWNPFFIRRKDDLNTSLKKNIADERIIPTAEEINNLIDVLFNDTSTPNQHLRNVVEYTEEEKTFIAELIFNLQKLTEHYLRPVYLIFDQFEELLILGSGNEKKLFIKTLKILLGPNAIADCHIIFVMREEYFAWLDTFESDIPGILDRRLRVEPMRTKEIQSVIIESCKEFNITLEDPESNANQMINALSKRGDVALPYLQVYLDQLWRKDYNETYPSGYTGAEKYVPLTFTKEEITQFGEIKDVLQRFLLEQKRIVQNEIKHCFEDVPDNFVNQILDCFINDQGTKRPNIYTIENGYYKFKKNSPKLLRDLDPKLLKNTLDLLQRSQILRNDGNIFELGHDALAKLVDNQRDSKQQRLNGIRVMISIQKKSGELIPYDLVKNWERYIDQLDLKDEERLFFNESKLSGEKEENERLYKKTLENALIKREEEYKITMMAKRNLFAKKLLFLSLLFIAVLVFFYGKSLKSQDTLHAQNAITRIETISNKRDAITLAKYVYDFKDYDDDLKNNFMESMMKLVMNPNFPEGFSKYTFPLWSSTNLTSGLDIDISSNGKYMSVRNDHNQKNNQYGKFSIINFNTKKVLKHFYDVNYAYFLNGSDTLLLAISDPKRTITEFYPTKFELYDCAKDSIIKTVLLNNSNSSKNYLYDKEFINSTTYSEWDSYKVNMMSSGKLIVPCTDFDLFEGRLKEKGLILQLDLKDLKSKNLVKNNSNYSISITRKRDNILYAYDIDKSNIQINLYSNNDSQKSLFRNAKYADFMGDSLIIYAKKDTLFQCDLNGKTLKKRILKTEINKIYNLNTDNLVLVLDVKDHLNLIDLNGTQINAPKFKEEMIGCDFHNKRIITRSNDRLVLRNYSGQILKTISINEGIDNLSFNSNSNSILLRTAKLSNKDFHLLQLYDSALGLKGAFWIEPSMPFQFSRDGKSFFFVRNNKLMVFDNKKYPDLTNFETVNTWLKSEKLKNKKKYKSDINNLQKTYHIDKFPTQKLGFIMGN